jgi:hypothetical protein
MRLLICNFMVAVHYEKISRKCNHFVALNLKALSRGSHARLFSARLHEDVLFGEEPLYHTLTSASVPPSYYGTSTRPKMREF